MKKQNVGFLSVVCLLVFVFAIQTTAFGVDFSGKTVNLTVPFKEGGGTDVYARMYAPYLKKYLPGNPTVLVRNLPGGASIKAANRFQRARPDGLTLMAISSSTYLNFMLSKDKPKIKFDLLSWNPVVTNSTGLMFFVSSTTGAKGKDQIKDFKHIQSVQLSRGVSSPTSATMSTSLAFNLLGKSIKNVFGVGTSAMRQAFLRDEFNVSGGSMLRFNANWMPYVEQGKVIPIATYGVGRPDGVVERDFNYPEMMTFNEIVEKIAGGKPSGPAFDVYTNFFYTITSAGKGLVLPKGTPQDIIDVWVKAAKACYTDPEFMKKANVAYGKYPVYFGKDARKIMEISSDMKPENLAWYRKWVKEQYGIEI